MGAANVRAMLAHNDRVIEETASIVAPHDHHQVELFAARLSGLGGLQYRDLLERCDGMTVPGDFRHLRLFNMGRKALCGGRISWIKASLTLSDILLDIACAVHDHTSHPNGPGLWTSTVALPVVYPGMLELGLVFDPLR
jgi:hypothetical protein